MPTETDTTLPPIHRVAVRHRVTREPISVGSQDYLIYIGNHAFARLRMLLTHAYIDKAKVSLSTLGAVPVTMPHATYPRRQFNLRHNSFFLRGVQEMPVT